MGSNMSSTVQVTTTSNFPTSSRDVSRFIREIESTSLISCIGNTPLLPIRRMWPSLDSPVKVFCKAEFMNPGGSVKDRAAWMMIKEAMNSGKLTTEKTIIDATSGNTGIGYALIAAILGLRVVLCIPKNASKERIQLLKAYGVELVLTDPLEGIDGAIQEARRIHAENPDQYFYPDQYNNDNNWKAHYLTTGPEIWRQSNGRVTHFVCGLGTSGTFMGVGRFLKQKNPDIQLIAVQPDHPFHGIEGLKHMQSAMVPGIYDESLADMHLQVSTEEAQEHVRLLTRNEGVLVGLSSGAALAAALKVARTLDEGFIVVVFPDRGDRYLSEQFWEDP